MTDFMPESAGAGPESSSPPDFWESTRSALLAEPSPAPSPAPRSARVARPAAALAADVHELLQSMARTRVPRLDAVRRKLREARACMDLAAIAPSAQALQAATTALDFLDGRTGGERGADFLRQGEALQRAGRELSASLSTFLERQGIATPVARLVWIELVLESASLHKRVRQGAHWLVQMQKELQGQRRQAGAGVASRALDELARRSRAMHQRLHTVHRLCGDARRVHTLCEQLAAEHGALCTTLQARVQPALATLAYALEPLLEAAAYRALVPTELIAAIDAHHALQVELTRALAQIERLHDGNEELAGELASMEVLAARAG
jgi:hypothetical protein